MDLTLSADALHPNNNAESVNVGVALDNKIPGFGEISVRGGMKGGMNDMFIENNNYGFTAGVGVRFYYLGNRVITIDHAYKTMGVLGNVQALTVGFSF